MQAKTSDIIEVAQLEEHRTFIGTKNPYADSMIGAQADGTRDEAEQGKPAFKVVEINLEVLCNEDQYDTRLKVDSRTGNSAKLKYTEIQAETAKAICFRVCDYTNGGWFDTWFPKKLCSNLDPEAKTFWVWLVFMESNKPDLIPKGYRM